MNKTAYLLLWTDVATREVIEVSIHSEPNTTITHEFGKVCPSLLLTGHGDDYGAARRNVLEQAREWPGFAWVRPILRNVSDEEWNG